jgi:hypothetical protein
MLSATPSATAWTIVYSGAVTNGQYLFSFVAPSNEVATVLAGNQTANLYMTYAGTGGSTLTCKMEGYVYDPATSNSTDYAETATSFSVAKTGTLPTTPTTPIAVIPYATNLTGNLRYQIRIKATAANNVTSVTMWGGSNSISSVSFPVSDSVTLGARGATGIKDSLGNAGTYDSTARTLTTPALTPAGIAAAGGVVTNTAINLGTNHLTVTTIKPATNSTSAVQITKADGVTSVLTVDTSTPRIRVRGGAGGDAFTWTGDVDYGGSNRGGVGYDAGGATTAWIGNQAIGGDSVSARFDIRMGTSPKVTVMSGGNVGIGTNAPAAKLHVVGSAIIATDMTVGGSATVGGLQVATVEQVVTGAVRTVTSGNRYFFTTSTNVTLSASLTGGQVVNLAKISNTATNSISAIGQVGWEWTGGVMTNTITAGKSMTFGFLVDPSNGKTNAYATGVSN